MRNLSSNSQLIYIVLKKLQNENWIQKHQNGLFISRQLVRETLISDYGVKLKLDTIWRHFKLLNLHYNNLINYFSGAGWRDCFIFKVKEKLLEKTNFFCGWKQKVNLRNAEIEEIFNEKSRNKLLKISEEYQKFQDYYLNNGFQFKILRVLKYKWTEWCQKIHPLSLDIENLSHANFKDFGGKNVFNLWKNHCISRNFRFENIEKAKVNFENYSKINKKMIIKNYNNNSNQTEKQKQKADYRWDFRKAKDTSDRIKEWLEFEKGIKWLEDFYLKDIPIPGIGWRDVMHPDFNREEILLFKIDSQNGQYMLKNTNDDIIEAEVQEHD